MRPPSTAARLALVFLTLALSSGCSFKATLDQTMDTTSNVTGTTSSVHSWVSEDGLVRPEYKALALIAASRENVEQNIAAGSGEYLTAVGTLLGVPELYHAAFGAAIQRRYTQDWPGSHAAPEQWLAQFHEAAQSYRLPH